MLVQLENLAANLQPPLDTLKSSDSVIFAIPNIMIPSQESYTPSTFWGLTPEWGAILIPTCCTLIVFIFGHLINALIKKTEKYHETKTFRDTVFSCIKIMGGPVSEQKVRINKLAESIYNTSLLQNVELKFNRSLADKIGFASADKIFKYFVLKSSIPDFAQSTNHAFNIVSQLDYLGSVENEVRTQYLAYQSASRDIMDSWNTSILKIQDVFHNMNSLGVDDSLAKRLHDSFYNSAKKASYGSDVNVPVFYNGFLVTALKLIQDYDVKCGSDDSMVQLIKEIKYLYLVYERWLALKNGFRNVFSSIYSIISSSYSSLEDSMDYFEKKTKASWW